MRRPALQQQIARIISRRSLVQSPPRCCPELAYSTTAETAAPTLQKTKLPFRFESGLSLFAKRQPRPFPPPFLSPPSGSFSDPLSTHDRSRDRRAMVNGERIRGYTNGDDAVYANGSFIGVGDGVGAWSTRPGGHAGLWSRLILHFWALETEIDAKRLHQPGQTWEPDPVEYLQKAYEQTLIATSEPNKWQGTTTATGAHLYFHTIDPDLNAPATPMLYVTNVGDSQVMVLRPRDGELVYKTKEQWHWFDCPRQLGTNSPDTPQVNAVMDKVEIEENDIVLALSDGVIDNLWEHEIIQTVVDSIRKWDLGEAGPSSGELQTEGKMKYVADKLVAAAKVIATDPFAESPFMEHAVEEGLPMEGGKLDDISVVAAVCMRNKG